MVLSRFSVNIAFCFSGRKGWKPWYWRVDLEKYLINNGEGGFWKAPPLAIIRGCNISSSVLCSDEEFTGFNVIPVFDAGSNAEIRYNEKPRRLALHVSRTIQVRMNFLRLILWWAAWRTNPVNTIFVSSRSGWHCSQGKRTTISSCSITRSPLAAAHWESGCLNSRWI